MTLGENEKASTQSQNEVAYKDVVTTTCPKEPLGQCKNEAEIEAAVAALDSWKSESMVEPVLAVEMDDSQISGLVVQVWIAVAAG
jgi:hypothetical protein